MTYTLYWRKAISVSVLLHIFLLGAAGYLAAGLPSLASQTEEITLTLDLVNAPIEQAGNKLSIPEQSPLPESPAPATEPSPLEPVDTKPAVTANALTMTAVETPALPASGQPRNAGVAPSGSPVSKGVAAPGILSKIDPLYPPSARQVGLEGTVVLKVQILATGRCGEITVARSSGYQILDEAAISAVKQWQFIPAKDLSSGRSVACTTTLPVTFRLQGNKH